METVGLGFCHEDLPVGRRFRTIGRTVTETDITNFVSVTGMLEVLFINRDFREKESNIPGFAAPGALVYTFMEGLLTQSTLPFWTWNLRSWDPRSRGTPSIVKSR